MDYRPDRVELLRRQGIRLRTPEGGDRRVMVPIGLPDEVGPADLTIVAVKAHRTQAAALDLLLLMAGGGMALTLQKRPGKPGNPGGGNGAGALAGGCRPAGRYPGGGRADHPGRPGTRDYRGPSGVAGLAGGAFRVAAALRRVAWTAAKSRRSRRLYGKNSWLTWASTR